MACSDGVGLQLRLRGDTSSCEPPDVSAFTSSGCGSSAADVRPQDIAVLHGAQPLRARTPLVVFFQHPSFSIPRPRLLAGVDVPLQLDSWCLRPTVFGYLAAVPREPSRGAARARAAWVLAACLPLAIAGDAAAAPAAGGKVQRPQGGSISSPFAEDGGTKSKGPAAKGTSSSKAAPETTDAVSTPAPPALPYDPAAPDEDTADPDAQPSTEPSTPPAGDGVYDGTPVPAPTPTERPGAPADPAIVDAAWEGVDGFDVVLELKGAGKLEGRIGAVQRDTFTLIQAGTGAVLVLAKSGVQSVRARMPGPLPTKTGAGLLAGGITMTTIATPVFLTGLVFLGICPSCTSVHIPMLLVGGGVLGGGIPMIVAGAKRRRRYLEAVQERSFSPVVMRTPHGWTGGLRFRF